MSILAEPRRKQRISVDPQNVNWHRNQDKFGQKMLEKMGWSEGRGLGRNEQGITQNIALKANHTAKGLGCEVKHDKTWIAHHDDFANLLASLNEKKQPGSVDSGDERPEAKLSIEEKSKSSKSRIHYHRFTRGKDLSRCTEQDKAAIFGSVGVEQAVSTKKKSAKPLKEEEPKDAAKSDEVKPSENTKVSALSLNDYFAAKLSKMGNLPASLKAAHLGGTKKEERKHADDSANESDASVPHIGFALADVEPKENQKSKKTREQQHFDEITTVEETVERLSKEERRRRKRERREAEAAAAAAGIVDSERDDAEEKASKPKKKKKKLAGDD